MTAIERTAPDPPEPPKTAVAPGDKSKITEARSRDIQWLLRVTVQCLALLSTLVACIALLGVAQRIGWVGASSGEVTSAMPEGGGNGMVYSCPMHPEIQQDEPGTCPICGMKLVPVAMSSSRDREIANADASGGAARYICPMMCTSPQSEPGRCPVCAMELVKADSGVGRAGEGSVSIDAAARRILGIRTAMAEESDVYRTIRTMGEIGYDEERVAAIAAYVDGRIEKLFAEYVGVQVAEGDDLAVLYSPQLYSAQVEYLSTLESPALNALAGDGDRLSEVARDNLTELGMTEHQIDALRTSGEAQKRLRIASPIGGTVIAKHKVEGDYVKTGEPIYRVVDLSMVWLMLDLYPGDAAAVQFGQPVEAEMQSLPGEIYTGRVAFVSPMVDPKTRTVRVRVELTNFDGGLKPGDYATATVRIPALPRDQIYDPALARKWISPRHPQIIRSEPGECAICGVELIPTNQLGYSDEPLPDQLVVTVPRSAVLMAGDHSVVYVETEAGIFELREVAVGALTDTSAIILGGVAAGETVATDGNFLIDSQSQLTGNPSLMDPGRAAASGEPAPAEEAPHGH